VIANCGRIAEALLLERAGELDVIGEIAREPSLCVAFVCGVERKAPLAGEGFGITGVR
jgi:hypothetical protein